MSYDDVPDITEFAHTLREPDDRIKSLLNSPISSAGQRMSANDTTS